MRKTLKRRQSAAPKKYQQGGRVEDDSDRPEERGPVGLDYNSLLRLLRAEKQRERDADELLPDADFEFRMHNLARQGFFPPTSQQLAESAARRATERNERIGSAQRGQRLFERLLEREGRRIGAAPRYSQGRLEDSGFKKGGKVAMKKGKK